MELTLVRYYAADSGPAGAQMLQTFSSGQDEEVNHQPKGIILIHAAPLPAATALRRNKDGVNVFYSASRSPPGAQNHPLQR